MTAFAVALGYLLGTFPSADLVTRIATRGTVDIRVSGSGNPGAFNALRVLGKTGGAVVLLLDLVKGVAAGLLGWAIAGEAGAYGAATASVLGHVFPVWSRFRGGKGAATVGGSCIAVFPLYMPFGVLIAGVLALRTRRPAVAIVGAAVAGVPVALVAIALGWTGPWGPEAAWGLLAYGAVVIGILAFKFFGPAGRSQQL